MLSPVTPATVRGQVPLPLRLEDGSLTEARVLSFEGLLDGREHLAIALGDRAEDGFTEGGDVPLVRLHSECLTGDVLGSQRCDCGPQLREAFERIADTGGYLLYLRQEGRGIGLYNKLDAQMLLGLGVDQIDLLTNNPDKASQLHAAGIQVNSQVPTRLHLSPGNGRYLAAKAWRGHKFGASYDEGVASS